jgi:predicted nucleic acid-binding protein
VTLIDTSAWIDHLHRASSAVVDLLEAQEAAVHPFVIGELACGQIKRRAVVLAELAMLPVIPIASHGEALDLVEKRELRGRGLAWVDVHLLASCLLSASSLLTEDAGLASAARRVGIRIL